MKPYKVTIGEPEVRHELRPSHRMTRHFIESHMLVSGQTGQKYAEIRFYQTSKTTSCCFWLFGEYDRSNSGKTNIMGANQKRLALTLSYPSIIVHEGWKMEASDPHIEALLLGIAQAMGATFPIVIKTNP